MGARVHPPHSSTAIGSHGDPAYPHSDLPQSRSQTRLTHSMLGGHSTVIRRDHTSSTGFSAVPTASGMAAVMLETLPGQWDLVLIALCPLVIVKRCSGPGLGHRSTEAQLGANDCKTKDQLPFYAPYACKACCLTSLVHIQCMGPSGSAVTGDRYSRYTKSTENIACYIRGY